MADIRCPLCGRSGGHLLAEAEVCTRCRQELDPTPLALWRSTLGIEVAELAEASGLHVFTIQRALRGEPMGKRAAEALSGLTDIPVSELMGGE